MRVPDFKWSKLTLDVEYEPTPYDEFYKFVQNYFPPSYFLRFLDYKLDLRDDLSPRELWLASNYDPILVSIESGATHLVQGCYQHGDWTVCTLLPMSVFNLVNGQYVLSPQKVWVLFEHFVIPEQIYRPNPPPILTVDTAPVIRKPKEYWRENPRPVYTPKEAHGSLLCPPGIDVPESYWYSLVDLPIFRHIITGKYEKGVFVPSADTIGTLRRFDAYCTARAPPDQPLAPIWFPLKYYCQAVKNWAIYEQTKRL